MEWSFVKLGDFCEIIAGQSPEGKYYNNIGDGLPFYQGKKEFGNRYIKDPLQWTTKVTKEAKSNDILMSVRAPVGPINFATQKVCIGRGLAAIRANEQLDNDFLFYYLLSKQDEIKGSEGAVFASINKSQIQELSFPYVNLPEQKRIVAILDKAFADIDRARAITEQNLKNARELFDSYLQQVFSQRGEGWNDERLESICTFSSGGTPSKKNSSYWSGNIPWVSGRDMKSAQLFDSLLHISQSAINEASARMAKAGTILVLVRGMGLAHGAQVAELMVPCAFNQDIKGIHPKPNIVSRYLAITLRYHINISENIISSAAHGTLKINMDDLNNVIIPVPPTVQQKHLVDKFGVFIKEINYLETVYLKKLDALDELKKSILQKAFSGELTKDDKGAAA
jgi:type I restriction enzyme S subunit